LSKSGKRLTARRRWTLDGDGLDGNVRCDGNWWTAMDGLTAMGHNVRLINGDGWWMAMDCDGRRNGHSKAMDLTAMDGEGRLHGD
jgi:hypothetical protein